MRSDFTILAIDDDANYLMLIEHAWRSTGVNNPFQCATRVDQAFQYLEGEGEYSDRNRFPYPGLITLDLKMPRVDGFSVLQRLKSNPEWADIRSVVLTGSASPGDIKKAYLLGACAYHVKPDAYEDLAKLLRTMFDYWQTTEMARDVIPYKHIEPGFRSQEGQKIAQR
jgi:CheY-like chemotaxis protein